MPFTSEQEQYLKEELCVKAVQVGSLATKVKTLEDAARTNANQKMELRDQFDECKKQRSAYKIRAETAEMRIAGADGRTKIYHEDWQKADAEAKALAESNNALRHQLGELQRGNYPHCPNPAKHHSMSAPNASVFGTAGQHFDSTVSYQRPNPNAPPEYPNAPPEYLNAEDEGPDNKNPAYVAWSNVHNNESPESCQAAPIHGEELRPFKRDIIERVLVVLDRLVALMDD